MENQNNAIFDIDEKFSVVTDKADVKSLEDIATYLEANYDIEEFEAREYAEKIHSQALTVVKSINDKMKDRKISVQNLSTSDDEMVKNYVDLANAEIMANIKDLSTDINASFAKLNTKISGMNQFSEQVYRKGQPTVRIREES